MNPQDVAWAAGFFDGEGCTTLRKRRSRNGDRIYLTPSIKVAQCQREVLDKFRDIFRVGRVNGPYNRKTPHQRPVFHYSVDGHENVQFILAAMWKHLSTQKRTQATKVLQRWRSGYIGFGSSRIYSEDRPMFGGYARIKKWDDGTESRAQQLRAEGKSYQAIAEELGVPQGTVGYLLYDKARRRAARKAA